jgi:hypothetical protein
MSMIDNGNDVESIIKWFDKEVGDGENSIVVYPDLQTFRQIYTRYVKEKLAKPGENTQEDEESTESANNDNNDEPRRNKQSSNSRIVLIAAYYETVDSVKHHLIAFGIKNVQKYIDEGSLVIVDSFYSFFPDVNGMKKLIDSLSQRAKREGRAGVTALVDMGPFFLFGGDSKAKELINYETSLASKTQDSNVKGFSCYHIGNYNTLTDEDKEEITQRQKKKLLEIREGNTR